MLQDCKVRYKQHYKSHVHNMTVRDQNQLLTDTANKGKAFWTLVLLLHGDKAQSLWHAVTWGLHSHGVCQRTEAAWVLRPLTSVCPSRTLMQSVPLQLLRVVQYGRSDDDIGY